MINQCTKLLSPAADPTYIKTYIGHSFPQHRQYLCSGAWILMQDHPENINSANLVKSNNLFVLFHLHFLLAVLYISNLIHGTQAYVLREFSPEEVTANIYTMVDVMLHHLQMREQPLQVLHCLISFPHTQSSL